MKPNQAVQQNTPKQYPFGVATVAKPDFEMAVYDSKYSRSVRLLDVVVPIVSCGLNVIAAVYASIPKSGENAGALVIEPSINRKHVKFDETADTELFKTHALKAAQSWPGWAKREAEAEALLTGNAVKRETANMAPRLVRKLAAAAEPNDGSQSGTKQPTA